MPCPPSGWGPSDCQGPQGFGTASLHMGNPLGQNCSFSISFLKHTWQHLGPHSLSSPRAVWPVCQAQPWPFLVGLSGCWLTSTLAVTPQTGTTRPFVAWQPLPLALVWLQARWEPDSPRGGFPLLKDPGGHVSVLPLTRAAPSLDGAVSEDSVTCPKAPVLLLICSKAQKCNEQSIFKIPLLLLIESIICWRGKKKTKMKISFPPQLLGHFGALLY